MKRDKWKVVLHGKRSSAGILLPLRCIASITDRVCVIFTNKMIYQLYTISEIACCTSSLVPFRTGHIRCACTLESLSIDVSVCCIRGTHIQDSSSVVRLTSPSSPLVKSHLRLSRDSEAEAEASATVGIGMSPSKRAKAALLDWIPANCRLDSVTLGGSC